MLKHNLWRAGGLFEWESESQKTRGVVAAVVGRPSIYLALSPASTRASGELLASVSTRTSSFDGTCGGNTCVARRTELLLACNACAQTSSDLSVLSSALRFRRRQIAKMSDDEEFDRTVYHLPSELPIGYQEHCEVS